MAQAIDRVSARRFTRLAQGGALVALLSGVAVAAFIAPGGKAPEVTLPEPGPAAEGPQGESAAAPVTVDSGGIAERLALIQNSPKPPETPQGPGKPDELEHAGSPHAPVVRYLGPVGTGNVVLMALIDDDGRQRFAGVGDRTSAGSVRSLSPTELVLADADGKQTKFALLDRGAETVTRTGAARGSSPTRFSAAIVNLNQPASKGSGMATRGPEYEARKGQMIAEYIEKLRGSGDPRSELELKQEADRMAAQSLRMAESVGTAPPPPPSPQEQKDRKPTQPPRKGNQ